MAEYLIQSETLDDIADAINAKTGGSSAMTPAEMATAIAAIPSGTTITDGIVFTAFDANGNPTAADIYGNLPLYAFGCYNNQYGYGVYITSVAFRGETEKIGAGAFQRTAITNISIPDSVNVIGAQLFRGTASLRTYVHENSRDLYGYRKGAASALEQLTTAPLTTIQLGAVGKPLTALFYQFMTSGAYANLTLTIYCIGGNVDAFLSTARRAITGGKIVFKASEATEYNGTSYAAGDTILTSEVTA